MINILDTFEIKYKKVAKVQLLKYRKKLEYLFA